MTPRIHVYTICWNERRMLPFFFRHYRTFAERIVVYDNNSDDGSQELVREEPTAELKYFDSGGEAREDLELQVKDHAWKSSRGIADWVIVCDVDELLFHSSMFRFVEECQAAGVTIPVPTGYQMISDYFPTSSGQIHDEVRLGFPDHMESKPILFDPREIDEINYGPGGHDATPHGRVVRKSFEELKLLHFKFLGWDYLRARYRELAVRKSHYDRVHNWGFQYFLSDEELQAKFAADCANATPIIE